MAGLDDWLVGLANLLNEMLRTSLRIGHDPVRLGPGGGPAEPGRPGILLTLVALGPAPPARPAPQSAAGAAVAAAAPFELEAHLMMTAVAEPPLYAEALKFLSLAMGWLHDHPILSAGELGLHAPGALAIELAAPPLDRLAPLLAACPTGGMPFALYRLRGMAIGAGPEPEAPIVMDGR
ncbi:MAG TPA: Pvc16 family protein [Allosphingosinicella sp.]|nr:Pvc16 family protein [Allosphingosinicella sp.]